MPAAGWGSIIATSSPRTRSIAAWGDRRNARQSNRDEASRGTGIVKRAVRKSKQKISRASAASKSAKMYRTNMREVPKVEGHRRKEGGVDMKVQFLIDKAAAGADHVIGGPVLNRGARHERHRHHHCDEFFIVLKGHGHIY